MESLKTPADEDIDPLERAYKNNDVELGEGEDFGDEAIAVVSATSSISSSATSSVTPIQQNLPSTSTIKRTNFLKENGGNVGKSQK